MSSSSSSGTGWQDGIRETILEVDPKQFPQTGGAYVLGTADGTALVYPWGTSPVFYIGRAGNLRKRLAQHQRFLRGARVAHDEREWYPRYQYGAAFGASVAWFSVRGRQTSQALEALLMDDFYEIYGAVPVANGGWPRGWQPPPRQSQQ